MASSFADDFNKRKKLKEKLSKGDYSLDTSSSNTFEETVKEAAPPALKKSGSSSGSSSKKKSTTVKSTKSTVGDTVKKATSGSNSSKVKKQYIDDPDHENGTPVEDDDDRDRDEVSIFDEADEVKKDDDKESVSFAPKFSGTASVFSDIAKSAFPGPGNDDEDDGSVFSARSKVKSRHESAEEIKKDPSKLYKQNEKNSAFYNDFQRRKSTRDVFVPASRSEDESGGDNDGRSLYEITKDASFEGSTGEPNTPFETEPQLLDDKKELTDEAEKYITAGVRLDDVFDDDQVVSREYSRKSANNVMYDVVTYTMSDGKKIELVKDSAHTKELDAKYLSRYLNEDQIMTYYYLRGRFGKGEADDYLYNDLIPEAEDTDFYTLNVQRNKDFASEHPVITAAITPFTGAHNIVQEASNQVKSIAGKETTSRDTSASDAFSGRNQAVAESDLPSFLKLGAQAGLGALYNLPEMALGFVPGIGQGLSAAAGALSAMGDKRAQLRAEGNLDAEHAAADILVSGIVGGLEWNALTKLVSSPVSKLIGNASGMKAVIGDVAKNALGAAGVGAAQQYLDSAMDQFFLQDESAFERTKQYYISQGMSEDEAHMQSFTENYVKPGINAALTGAVTGATYGLPNSIASGLQALPPAEIRANGNVNTVINFGLNAPENTYARVYAETLSAKRQQGTKITDEEISVQAGLNAIELNRRANLMRFEVNTSDDVPDSGQGRTRSDNSGQIRTDSDSIGQRWTGPDADTFIRAAVDDGPFIRRDAADGNAVSSGDTDSAFNARDVMDSVDRVSDFSGDISDVRNVSRTTGDPDGNEPVRSDAAVLRGSVKSAVDDHLGRLVSSDGFSDTARTRFEALKDSYTDVAHKLFKRGSDADVSDTNKIRDKVSGKIDGDSLRRLTDIGNSMFAELSSPDFDARALAESALRGFNDVDLYSANVPDTDSNAIRYSSEDERYRDDSRAFKVNTGLEKAVSDVFGRQNEFNTERIERDIFDFTETAVNSFDRLIDVSNENYNDALVTSYSELIEAAARSFYDVSDLFPSDDAPRKIAAAALHGFIKDNSLGDASAVIDAADSAFEGRFGNDSNVGRVERPDIDTYLRDIYNINLDDVMHSEDASVHMLYDRLVESGVSDKAFGHVDVDSLFEYLGQRYGTDVFDPDVYKTDSEKYHRIAEYAFELEGSENVRPSTPDVVRFSDIDLYDVDIESAFRSGLVRNEQDAVDLSNYVRSSVGDMIGAMKNAVDTGELLSSAAPEYNSYADGLNNAIKKATDGKGYTDDEKTDIASAMNDMVWSMLDSEIKKVRLQINDILTAYATDTVVGGRKINKEAADKAAGIKGMIDRTEYDMAMNSGHAGRTNITYLNTLQKDGVSGMSKMYNDQYSDSYIRASISNAESIAEAQKRLKKMRKIKSDRAILKSLWDKKMLDNVEIAMGLLLRDEFDSSGRYTLQNEAAQLVARALSRSGRSLQAAQIMDLMTPKAQFEKDVGLMIKYVNSEIEEFSKHNDSIKGEIEAARENDRRIGQQLDSERVRALEEIKDYTDHLAELDKMIDTAEPEVKRNFTAERQSLKERIELKREYVMSLSRREQDFRSKIDSVKKTVNERYKREERAYRRREQSIRRELADIADRLIKITDSPETLRSYSKKTRDTVTKLRNKQSQLNSELADARRYYETASSEFKKMSEWLSRMYTAADKLDETAGLGFEEEKILQKYKIKHVSLDLVEWARNMFNLVGTFVDIDEVIDFITGMSGMRNTGRGPHVRKMLENIGKSGTGSRAAIRFGAEPEPDSSKSGGIKILSDIAKKQIHGYVKDQMRSSLGQKINTVQTLSHLGNTRTILRNIFSTAAMSEVETLTHNVGAVIDRFLVSNITGKRSIGFEGNFTGIKGGLENAQLAAIGSSLNVPMSHSSWMDDARVTRRTFKSRPLSFAERSLGYALTVPDEFYKGIAEERTLRSLTRLGWSQDDIRNAMENEAAMRTFNDVTMTGQVLSKIKDALNHVGISYSSGKPLFSKADFGLGDLMLKYTMVPGNIIQRTVEYTPIGYLKALYKFGTTLHEARHYKRNISPAEQREMILNFARPTTGIGIIAAGAFLAKAGIIIGTSFTDPEYNEEKYEEAKGVDELMINLSRLGRLLDDDGGSDPQNGDILSDISFLQPFNELLMLGARLYEVTVDNDGFSPILSGEALLDVPFNVFGSLSMFQTLNNAVQTYEESKSVPAVAFGIAADALSGFIPGPVRHFGNVLDEYVRNPYKQDSSVSIAVDKLISKLPFMSLRDELPKSIDIWGNERSSTTGSLFGDIFNEMMNPGFLSVYTENEINDEIDRLLDISKDILPQIPYENNTGYIDGIGYSFKLQDKDYEEFSKLNGQLSYEGFRLMIDSYYYNEMPDGKRVEMLSEISDDANYLARNIWAARINGLRTEDEINTMISDFLEDVKTRAAYETKMAQALEYITRDDVNIEDALGSYAVVKVPVAQWSEDRVKDELASYDEKIYKLQTGEAWYKDEDGLWHQSKDWSPRTVETELEDAMFWRQRIIDGTATYDKYITGKWSDLSFDEKEAVLDALEKNIKTMSLPEAAIDHIPEYTLTLDGLKTQVSREKRQAAEEAARAAENGEAPAAEENAFADDYESPDYGEPVQKKSYSRRYYSRGNRYSSYYPRRYYNNYYGNYRGNYNSSGRWRGIGGYARVNGGGRSRFYPTSGYVPSSGYSSGGSGYGYGGSGGAFPDPFAEIIFNAFPHIFDKLTGGR